LDSGKTALVDCANFFVTLPDGTLLRRMVSTYISPLGIAYTGSCSFRWVCVSSTAYAQGHQAKWFAIRSPHPGLIGVSSP